MALTDFFTAAMNQHGDFASAFALLGCVLVGFAIVVHQVRCLKANIRTLRGAVVTKEDIQLSSLSGEIETTSESWRRAQTSSEELRREVKSEIERISQAREELHSYVSDLTEVLQSTLGKMHEEQGRAEDETTSN
jgi:septal ring factor EnvC (AmiA/AmiB activator)